MLNINPVPTPHLSLLIPSKPEMAASRGPLRSPPSGDPCAARKAYYAKKAEWSKLKLRQQWADEAFMRGHIKAAGIRIADNNEPATVPRLRSLLRRVGITGPEIESCLGTDLSGYLKLNPSLPLWAALALVLEATGRFTAKATA